MALSEIEEFLNIDPILIIPSCHTFGYKDPSLLGKLLQSNVSLQAAINLLQLHLRHQQNASAVIHRLPEELLQTILTLACPDEDRMESFCRMGSVCQAWRRLLLATPSFWSKITIRERSPRPVEEIEFFLNHSGTYPLDLDLTLIHPSSCDAFRLLVEHKQRWRILHLVLSLPSGHCLASLASSANDVLPNIEQLTLECCASFASTIPILDLRKSSKLRFADLQAWPVEVHLPWQFMTSLCVNSLDIFETALELGVNLRDVCLSMTDDIPALDPSMTRKFWNHSLEHLEVTEYRSEGWQRLFRFQLPALKSFLMDGSSVMLDSEMRGSRGFFKHTFRLHKLVLSFPLDANVETIELWKDIAATDLPSLEILILRITDTMDDHFLGCYPLISIVGIDNEGHKPLPKLRQLGYIVRFRHRDKALRQAVLSDVEQCVASRWFVQQGQNVSQLASFYISAAGLRQDDFPTLQFLKRQGLDFEVQVL